MAIDSLTGIANRHDYDTTLTVEYDADQTNATILTPTSGRSLAIKSIYVTSEATTGFIRFLLGTDTVATVYYNSQPGQIWMYKVGGQNVPLKITSTGGADKNYFIHVNYKEE